MEDLFVKELRSGGDCMSPIAERVLEDDEVFTSSMESIEVVTELERRRTLVAEGKSRVLTEEESWERIRAAGYEV